MIFLPEPLDANLIMAAMDPKSRNYLSKLEIFDSIDSTNAFLLECAKKNTSSGHVCLANQQTKGHGRFGKYWHSPPGANIYLSLFWCFPQLKHELPGLSIALAVMIAKVLQNNGIEKGLQLKWPNDILFSGKKLCGVLIETSSSNSSNNVVIGIGLNLYRNDDQIENAIALSEIVNRQPERNRLVGLLIGELFQQLPIYEQQGLSAFLQDWRQFDVLAGKLVTIHTPQKQTVGKMLGINQLGELLLEVKEGSVERFRCGEVSVRMGHSR